MANPIDPDLIFELDDQGRKVMIGCSFEETTFFGLVSNKRGREDRRARCWDSHKQRDADLDCYSDIHAKWDAASRERRSAILSLTTPLRPPSRLR
ncbi:MAG TPA: hypothetical protein VGN95_21340 [Pyrinomonadaceae bacterium]|jgi:hypothetical protein|nr:hypothetical protein [Pyrinomonadaceae bacterium]